MQGMQAEQDEQLDTRPPAYPAGMTETAAQLSKKLEATKQDLVGLKADLPTFQEHYARAEADMTEALRSSATDATRDKATEALEKARRRLDGQHRTIAALQDEAKALQRGIEDQAKAEARTAADQRLQAAHEAMQTVGAGYLDAVEGPMREVAAAWHELEQARKAALALGVQTRAGNTIWQYIEAKETGTAQDDWWLEAGRHIVNLSRQLAAPRNAEAAARRKEAAEARKEQAQRAAKKRILARMRVRTAPGEKDRRKVLEAEVGAELNADERERELLASQPKAAAKPAEPHPLVVPETGYDL